MSKHLYLNAHLCHLIYLNRGCYDPVVGTVQVLLCQYPPHADLKIDMIFGPKTEEAVKRFQKWHKLGVDGFVGNETWRCLSRLSGLRIVDVVNAAEPALLAAVEASIHIAGGVPIVISPGSAGLDEFVQKVAYQVHQGQIALLRIHGHGNVGYQTLSTYADAKPLGGIQSNSPNDTFLELALLKPYFSKIGSAQLHGCHVGLGNPGSALLWRLVGAWNVPVSAGTGLQFYEGADSFRFEGSLAEGYGQTQWPSGCATWKQFMRNQSKIRKGDHRHITMAAPPFLKKAG